MNQWSPQSLFGFEIPVSIRLATTLLDVRTPESTVSLKSTSGGIGRRRRAGATAFIGADMPKSTKSILVIDDEPQIRRLIAAGLELHGFTVEMADTGSTGLNAAARSHPDVIVLDLGLPDMSGIEVLESLRAWSNVPVIMLSIESDEEKKVLLLKLGADDYMVKPFSIAELAARCEAALRRYDKSAEKNPIVRTGPLVVDLISRSVIFGEKPVPLTRTEYRLLHILASHLGLVVTHEQLIREIWGKPASGNVQYLRVLMRQVRRKIEPDRDQPKFLITESGVGYRLERHEEMA
jgi:two-component system, OmpR family, KDP operon response regulator KdpE